MQITPPFGYRDVTPLQSDMRVRLPEDGSIPAFARTLNAVPVTFTELQIAMRDYPVVFVSGDEGKTFRMVAALGLANRENLFLRGDAWEPGTYVPAYFRRYPFCMTRLAVDSVEQSQRLICVERDALVGGPMSAPMNAPAANDAGDGSADDAATSVPAEPAQAQSAGSATGNAAENSDDRVLDFTQGEPTDPRWVEMRRFLTEYEADLERTIEVCSVLANYKLLEPFTVQATHKEGGSLNLGGMYRVKESQFEHLTSAELKTLVRKGAMGIAYLHLASLARFHQLLDRKATLAPAPPASTQAA